MKKFYLEKLKPSLGEILFLSLIFGVSFGIRYIGLRFSYPLLTHPDEGTILSYVYEMTANHNLNPGNFMRPNQVLYMLNLVYLNAISFIDTGKSFAATFQSNKYEYYFYSRILIALMGSLIPLVAYKIGKVSPIKFAIPAALLFAFFPLYVRDAHYVTPDVPITLFTLLVVLFAIQYTHNGKAKYLYLATFFVAVNTAEKYPGLISFGIIFLAITWVQAHKNKGQLKLIIRNIIWENIKLFGFFLLALYIIAPNLFIYYDKVITQVTREARDHHTGADALGWFGNMKFYASVFLDNSHVITALFFFLGIFGFIRKKVFEISPMFYGLLYMVLLSVLALHWERWALPMYTAPLLLAAFGFSYLYNFFITNRVVKSIILLAFGFTILWSFLHSFSISTRMTYTDTMVASLRYCNENGITPENSTYEGYTPFNPNRQSTFRLYKMTPATEYVILSSQMYDRYYQDPERYKGQIGHYEQVKNNFELVKEFSSTFDETQNGFSFWIEDAIYYIKRGLVKDQPERLSGPTILIYRVK